MQSLFQENSAITIGFGPFLIGKGYATPCLLVVFAGVKGGRVLDTVFDDMFESAYQTLDGPSGSIAQGTDGVSFNGTRDLVQHGDFTRIRLQ